MDKKLPLVSIIVPVYNISQYIEKCISSIVQQSLKDIEIILVDDGSTDDSGIICDRFAELDSRIRVVHKENGGLVTARKEGLNLATGKYIGFVDGDDYIESDMYLSLYQNMEETGADFVYSGLIRSGNICMCLPNDIVEIDNIENVIREYFLDTDSDKRISVSVWSKLFRAEIIKEAYEVVSNEQILGEDAIVTLECLFQCKKFSLLNKAFYHYVPRADSITHTININLILQEGSLYTVLRGILEKYHCSSELFGLLETRYLFYLWSELCTKASLDVPVTKYIFPNKNILYGKRIAIYGAGIVGQSYYAQISCLSACSIVTWVDKNYEKYNFVYNKVEDVKQLLHKEFDVLLIAIKHKEVAMEIFQNLMQLGIDRDKIIWEQPVFIFAGN